MVVEFKEKLKIIKDICAGSYPMMFFYICLMNQQSINLIFISQKYDDYRLLQGMGISHLYVNLTATIIVIGLISGLDVLVSNAAGSKNYRLMGLYAQRGKLISYVYLITINIINYYFAFDLLNFFRVDPTIINIMRDYLRLYSIILFIDVPFQSNIRLINIFNKSHINSLIIITTFFLNFIWCYIYIFILDLGINGAALSMITTKAINLILSQIYLSYYSPHPEAIFPYSRESFNGWKDYLDIAIPSTQLLLANWMCFEIQSIFAIYYSDIDYSVHIIILTLEDFIFTIPLSFGTIVCMKIAKGIIDKSVEIVIETFKLGLLIVNINIVVILSLLKYFQIDIITLFTSDQNIINKGVETINALIFFCFITNAYYFTFYCLRGLNYLGKTVEIGLLNGYIFSPLLTYYLAYYNGLGVFGIWSSMGIGRLFTLIFVIYLSLSADYNKLKYIAIERTQSDIDKIKQTD